MAAQFAPSLCSAPAPADPSPISGLLLRVPCISALWPCTSTCPAAYPPSSPPLVGLFLTSCSPHLVPLFLSFRRVSVVSFPRTPHIAEHTVVLTARFSLRNGEGWPICRLSIACSLPDPPPLPPSKAARPVPSRSKFGQLDAVHQRADSADSRPWPLSSPSRISGRRVSRLDLLRLPRTNEPNYTTLNRGCDSASSSPALIRGHEQGASPRLIDSLSVQSRLPDRIFLPKPLDKSSTDGNVSVKSCQDSTLP